MCVSVHQMLVIKEVPHGWSSSLDQQHPERPNIQEEDEEQLTVRSEEEEKISGIRTSSNQNWRRWSGRTSTTFSVEQMENEPDGEDCGRPEPDRNPETCSSPESKMTVHRRGKRSLVFHLLLQAVVTKPLHMSNNVHTLYKCLFTIFNSGYCPPEICFFSYCTLNMGDKNFIDAIKIQVWPHTIFFLLLKWTLAYQYSQIHLIIRFLC